jgi:hypothetical protein
MLLIVNFYRTAGKYLKGNVDAYLEYLDRSEETTSFLNEVIVYAEEAIKFYLGSDLSAPQPTDYDYYLTSAGYSLDLSNLVSIPLNGTLAFDVYIDDASEVGTVFNMNGIATAIPGMLLVGVNENAVVEFNFYEPNVNSSCRDGAGWHHLYTDRSLQLYQWQSLEIGYGQEGLSLSLEGELHDSCAITSSRANTALYLGDYPDDSIDESFVGYVKNIRAMFTLDENGQKVDDTVKENLIFVDVDTSHPNAEAIEYLKDKGIIQGYSDGTFRPGNSVNRAEILKMLLLGLGYKVPENKNNGRFTDLEQNSWYLSYVNYAVDLAVIAGYSDGTYRPAGTLNRVEFLKILLRTYGLNLTDYPISTLYPDTPRDAWYAAYVQYSKDYSLMDTDAKGNFNPGNAVTPGEVAETIWRLLTD